jgi:hypothetical protein
LVVASLFESFVKVPPPLIDREVVRIDNYDEQGVGLFLTLPAGVELRREFAEDPSEVATVLCPARDNGAEVRLLRRKAAPLQVRFHEPLMEVIFAQQDRL